MYEILKQNIREGTFMTPLHGELYNKINIELDYTPNVFLFQFLNGGSEEKFVSLGLYVDTNMADLVIVTYTHVESRYNRDCIGLDTKSLP